MEDNGEIQSPPIVTSEQASRRKERREIPIEHAKFLAGLLEMGGGMAMNPATIIRQNAKGEQYPYTSVAAVTYFNDGNEAKVRALQKMFGGSVKKEPKQESWRWLINGKEAANILGQIEPYAPFRREQIHSFQKYAKIVSMKEKIELANAFTEYNNTPKSYPDQEEYQELVNDPSFLAGMYAARGNEYGYDYRDALILSSQNLSLIATLTEKYHKEFYPIPKMETVGSDGRVTVPFRLQLNAGDKADFLSSLNPNLVDFAPVQDLEKVA